MAKIWITSDTHFCHYNIIEYCSRPFSSVEEMNKTIIKNWNVIVKKDDVIYHLGDVGFGNKETLQEIVSKLNGRKRLIMGNHDDALRNKWIEIGFEWVSKYPILLNEYYWLSHVPLYMNKHMPYCNIHGHVHEMAGFISEDFRHVNVSVDKTAFKPVLFNYIQGAVEKQLRI